MLIHQQFIAMSKPNIKFIYTGQIRSEVQQLQKGPANLQNFYGSIVRPQYIPITLEEPQPQVVSTMEINSKPQSPNSLLRYKSAENIRMREQPSSSNASNKLNIEEVGESEMVTRKKVQSKKPNKNAQNSDQIVLKAPSYKLVPRKEGDIAVHSRKQFKQHASVQKALNGESALRSRKHGNKNNDKDLKLKAHPFNMIQTINERDFKEQPSAQQPFSSASNSIPPTLDERIVLKAPKYKYNPQPQGDIVVHNRKKQYVKSENTTEKYFYGGLQERKESEFVSCFGCIKPTAKTYKVQDE